MPRRHSPPAGRLIAPGAQGVGTRRLERAIDRMIMSASGWRGLFAAGARKESRRADVNAPQLVLVALAARAFARGCPGSPTVAVATDTRPTGPSLAAAAIRGLLAEGAGVHYLGVAAAPEIMAYARSEPEVDGFFYLSASHNPIGYNGIKVGGGDGGVFDGPANRRLVERFRLLAADRKAVRHTDGLLREEASEAEQSVYRRAAKRKSAALEAYASFTAEVVRGPGAGAGRVHEQWITALRAASPGVVADLNGSARSASIDGEFLRESGCRLMVLHGRPGDIAHQILPEGAGLAECAKALAARTASGFLIGYVPDNDGDRGNLVVYDETAGQVRELGAQEVFAIACVAELSWMVATGALAYRHGHPLQRVAVVVNDPTSLRVDRIARAFGASVHRAEVGEANVVALARALRAEGHTVRILGEGSNGGVILHPSAVRDPIHTVHSILKLLVDTQGRRPSPLRVWVERSRTAHAPADRPFGAGALLRTLPAFTTTGAYEPRAVLRIGRTPQAAIKERIERVLPARWRRLSDRLREELDVVGYEVVNYEGTRTLVGPGNRTGDGRGGFKILFHDAAREGRAFVWMRGSGTEPVLRVMADVEGERSELESDLLRWLTSMIADADQAG